MHHFFSIIKSIFVHDSQLIWAALSHKPQKIKNKIKSHPVVDEGRAFQVQRSSVLREACRPEGLTHGARRLTSPPFTAERDPGKGEGEAHSLSVRGVTAQHPRK